MSGMSFTCIACRVAFADGDLQRLHYKSDWHRYNLKRKVADLPPVTAENFQQRVLAQRAQATDAVEPTSFYCSICNKQFNTQNAYDNHLKSKKHKENEDKQHKKTPQVIVETENRKNVEKGLTDITQNEKQSLPQASNSKTGQSSGQGERSKVKSLTQDDDDEEMDSDGESVESWEGEALGLEECLFCSKVSKTMEDNIKHMSVKHSFFIPDAEYLVDLEGLLIYLGEKVGLGNMCLWCSEKGKSFYSTRSVQQHMLDKGHCKMLNEGDTLLEYADFFDYRSSYPDYEEGKDVEMKDDDEEEEEVPLVELDVENYQLVLPSGNSVGHRSLMCYYKQNLPPKRKVHKTAVDNILGHYKALGWKGTTGEVVKKKVQDLNFVHRQRQRFEIRVGMKQNKLPKYVRNQTFFGMKT